MSVENRKHEKEKETGIKEMNCRETTGCEIHSEGQGTRTDHCLRTDQRWGGH